MGSPEERARHARRRQRNFVAKRLREDARFKQTRIERKIAEESWDKYVEEWYQRDYDDETYDTTEDD